MAIAITTMIPNPLRLRYRLVDTRQVELNLTEIRLPDKHPNHALRFFAIYAIPI